MLLICLFYMCRTFVVIRHWLTHYWAYDFMSSRTLRFMLCTFLTQLRDHPVILASPRDERIIRNLRSVLKRQRTFHKSSSFDQRLSSLSTSTWRESQQSRSLLFKSGSTSTVGDRSYRKDSAIGLHVSNQSTPPSISLSFLSRSHRLSSSSSTKSSEAWTSKMNSGLKSIKKSIGKISTSSTSHCDHKDGCLCERPIGPTDPTSPLPFHHMFFSRTTIKPDRPFVMRYRSELIAQQFCLIEQSMLQNVTWDELVELRWKKQNSKKRMSSIGTIVNVENIQKTIDEQVGVDQLIGFFNMVSRFL